jgi:hypothetical protein
MLLTLSQYLLQPLTRSSFKLLKSNLLRWALRFALICVSKWHVLKQYHKRKFSHLLFGCLSKASSWPLPRPLKSLSSNDSQLFHVSRHHATSALKAASHVTRESLSSNDQTRQKMQLVIIIITIVCFLLWFIIVFSLTWSDNKVRELATACLPCQPYYSLMTLTYQHFTAVLLLSYGNIFLSGIYYCLRVFRCAAARMSELEF